MSRFHEMLKRDIKNVTQGIHRIVGTMYMAYDDMGCQPEKGQSIFVDGKQYYIVTSECEMGQLAIGLGAFDE